VIGTYKLLWMIDEALNYINRTCIELFQGQMLCFSKCLFWDFLVVILALSPILYKLNVRWGSIASEWGEGPFQLGLIHNETLAEKCTHVQLVWLVSWALMAGLQSHPARWEVMPCSSQYSPKDKLERILLACHED
jgi:hypothetical protein